MSTEALRGGTGLKGHGGNGVIEIGLARNTADDALLDGEAGKFGQRFFVGGCDDHEVVGFQMPAIRQRGPIVEELGICMNSLGHLKAGREVFSDDDIEPVEYLR